MATSVLFARRVVVFGAALVAAFAGGCKDDPKPTTSPAPASSVPAAGGPMSAASVAAIVNPQHAPTCQGATGSVEGTVFITGDAPPPLLGKNYAKCPAATQTRAHLFRTGAAVARADGGAPAKQLADAIVAIKGFNCFAGERDEARKVVVEACEEFPRTIDMTFGQRLEVQNKTAVLFAPALEEARNPALMVAPPGGDFVKLYVPHPGRYTLSDKLGGDFASGDVYALGHPFHAVSGHDGHYRIDGIPLGKITVGARLSAIGKEMEVPVEVLAGVVHRVDITLSYTTPAEPPPAMTKDAGTAPPLLH